MPTLIWLDSFEHQNAASTYYGTNAGLWDTGPSSAFALWSYVTGRRTGSHALRLAQNGTTAARAGKQVAAGNRVLVESFYFKCSAKPSVDSALWAATGAVSNSNIRVQAGTGFLMIFAVSAGTATVGNVDVTDGQWHRIDLKLDSSANPYKLDVSLDGSAMTQNTSGAVAGDINSAGLGTTTAAHTLTADYADWVRSVTGADHPIGGHICVPLIVNADGTHNWSTTHFDNEAGNQSSSVTTLNTSVDDWLSGAADTTTYVGQNTGGAANTEYAELLMPDVGSGATVWAARAVAAIFSPSTAANSATTRIVDGSGTTVLDLYTGDQSDTGLRHQASLLPGIDTPSEVNALMWRVGFATDANPEPRWSALMVDIALPGATGDGTATPSAVAGVGAVPAPTATGNGVATPGAVAGVGSVPAPTADGGTTPTATPAAVAGIGAVPAPTATGTATASPAATAGVGTVPAPTTTGTASTTPATVAGVGTVPAPTAQGNATATPGAVAGIGSVPAPTGRVDVAATPAAVAGIGSVPAPTPSGTATASPNTTAGNGLVGVSNSGLGGVQGATVSTLDQGQGTPWETVTPGVNSSITYDNKAGGMGRSIKVVKGATGTDNNPIAWDVALVDGDTQYGQIVLWFDTAPASAAQPIVLYRAGVTNQGFIRIRTDGKIEVVDAAGTAQATSSTVLTGALWRIEWRFVRDASTGSWLVNLYSGTSSVITETLNAPNINTGAATTTNIRFGTPTGVSTAFTFWVRTFNVNQTELPSTTLARIVPAPTAAGTATATPGVTAGIGSVPAPAGIGGAAGTANPATVAGIGSVPPPTASGAATAAPVAVTGTGSVPAPTTNGRGTGAPATVAGIGSVPAPTLHGNATATPGTVAGIGDIPAPTATTTFPGVATPDEVAGIGAVPAPTVAISAFAHPATVAGIGSVPAPTGRGDATAYPLGSCNGDEFTDDFTDDFGGFGPFSTEFSIEFDDVGSCFGPVAGIGAVPAPNAHGQGPPQQQHDFDPGRMSPRLVARARAGWSARPKEPALAGRANPEGGG